MQNPNKPRPEQEAETLLPRSEGALALAPTYQSPAGTLTPPPRGDIGSSSDAPTVGDFSHRRPAPAAVLLLGSVVAGRYEILQGLGQGGMGTVYKAKDLELDRLVALKVVRPELALDPAIIQRFKQELVLARQVTHRNVIRIYDLGEAEGIKFITMEFVEGQDLCSLLAERGTLPPAETVEVMQQVCLALEAAHAEGVIHRDLKPTNIMRDKSGRVVVMDFGLARLLEGEGITQTGAGALIGTMAYMSPEQALGSHLDQRSDLYAVGLIFYELLTGKEPYKAESALASLLRRTHERAAPVTALDKTIPASLSNVVSKCLERDPDQRYTSAKELLTDLGRWQRHAVAATFVFPEVRTWARSHRRWMGVAAAAVILAVAGLLLDRTFRPATGQQQVAAKPEVSLAILPFRNASGDTALDGEFTSRLVDFHRYIPSTALGAPAARLRA